MDKNESKQTRLSSPYTFFYKIVLPTIQLAATAVCALILLLNDIQIGYIFIAIMIVVLFFSLKYHLPLKHVWLGHDHIIVKNISHRITIPLYSVINIKENMLFNPHYVVIKLRSDTEFGQKIIFIPDRHLADAFQFFKESKATQELKQAIDRYKQGTNL